MAESLITPPEIERLAEQVLSQLHGQKYTNAAYALEVAQRRLSRELMRLQEEQVFAPPASQAPAPRFGDAILHSISFVSQFAREKAAPGTARRVRRAPVLQLRAEGTGRRAAARIRVLPSTHGLRFRAGSSGGSE